MGNKGRERYRMFNCHLYMAPFKLKKSSSNKPVIYGNMTWHINSKGTKTNILLKLW